MADSATLALTWCAAAMSDDPRAVDALEATLSVAGRAEVRRAVAELAALAGRERGKPHHPLLALQRLRARAETLR